MVARWADDRFSSRESGRQSRSSVDVSDCTRIGPHCRTVTAQPRFYYRLRFIAWSPDGKWLAVSDGPNSAGIISVVLLSAETGQRIRVTFPPVNFDDFSPAFSPDMTRLIFVRYSNLGASVGDLYMVKLSKDLHPWGGNPSGSRFLVDESLAPYGRETGMQSFLQDMSLLAVWVSGVCA